MHNLNQTHVLKLRNEITEELCIDLKKVKSFKDDDEVKEKLQQLIIWLSNTPKNLVFRVNTILEQQQVAYKCIKNVLNKYTKPLPNISTFNDVEEIIIVDRWDPSIKLDLDLQPREVIVDCICGAAVLRGAHIYATGILGMPKGLKIGDKVSVYADLIQACKKGLIKPYEDKNKLFIGNGFVQMTREQIFAHGLEKVNGIAVSMIDIISRIPQLNENILSKGKILLQNMPSILCSRVLDPQPEETILDMCAAPGNKTTHIAALMKNKGTVIALDKIKNKVQKLILTIESFSVKNVKAFCFDSIKAVNDVCSKSILDGPPFSKESFDRILLDGPCSALGQRPQICNSITVSQLRSYIPLQRKLFTTAEQLLKPGGTLVYSTCTITVAENEGIVAWALKKFSNLKLQSVRQKLASINMQKYCTNGYNIDGLTISESASLCRFETESDSVGFFIACFIKE